MRKKILFITPSLARTGSEMVLWYLLSNLDTSLYEPFVFSLNKGELYKQLPSGIHKTLAYRESGKWYKKVFRGILKLLGIDPIGYQLKYIQKKNKTDLWFVNTLLIPQAHPMAHQLNVKVATYFHEVLFAFSFIKANEFENIIKYSDYLIGCSAYSCQVLNSLAPAKTKLQYSFIDEKQILFDEVRVAALKQKFNISEKDFVWVISGTMVYMKGFDLILEIVEGLKNEHVKIICIGGFLNNGLDNYVKTVVATQYANQVFFVGAQSEDYYNYFKMANGFLLCSREESFSLVLVEAAFLGIPIVAFNTGIASEIITASAMGELVDNGNINGLIAAMKKQQAKNYVDQSALKNSALKYTVANQLPRFEKLLRQLFN